MAKNNNLTDFLTDVANAIREKKGATGTINPQNFSSEIASIKSGSEGGGAGSVFKITNKLNGQLFGGPSYSDFSIIHTYSFEGGTIESIIMLPVNTTSLGSNYFSDFYISYYANGLGMTNLPSFSLGVHPSELVPCGWFVVEIDSHYNLIFLSNGSIVIPNSTPLEVVLIAFDSNKNYDIDFFKVQSKVACIVKDTKIKLKNDSDKMIQDINYNDELLVWNFDEGKYDYAKPLWIKKEQIENYYYKVTLSNGEIFKCAGHQGHRMFNITKQSFEYPINCIGDKVYTIKGPEIVLSCEKIEETVEYYNIITEYHMNLFADNILTSCRYNNLYPIKDMKFIKDDRLNRAPKWKLYEQFRDYRCLDRYIDGLRLYEQIDIPLEDTIKYCENLEILRKTLDEFDDNTCVINNIEDTEVGWIDRNGKAYGFKTYMPGQYNHIILADKICEELNIKTNNTSRYLEKEGWLKYTTNFVINSDDKIVSKEQLKTLRKFLNCPNKLQNPGKIRLGVYNSPLVDITEFENMDEYSFEYRKQLNLKQSTLTRSLSN